MLAGLGFFLVCGVLAAVVGIQSGASFAPYLAGIGALGYFVASIAAMIPQQVTIAIDGKTVTPSWRGAIAVETVEVGNWVVAGIDAAMGLAVTVRGPGGTLRIGSDKHAGEGYTLARPTRTIDCQLPADDLDALLAALGVARGPQGPLTIPLVRSSQSVVGVMRGMLPWLVTMSLMGVFGLVIGNTTWGEQLLKSPDGQLAIAIVSGGLAVFGIGWMIVRGRRIRMPELELVEEDDVLAIRDTEREVTQRVAWTSLTIERLTYSVSSRAGTFSMPLVVLRIPDRKPLRIGTWDSSHAWRSLPGAKTWRGPRWLVGAAKWPQFLDALKRHNRL